MKIVPFLVLAGLAVCGFAGCVNLSADEKAMATVVVSPPAIQFAATLATKNALKLAVQNRAEQKTVAADCEAAAAAVRSLSAGTPPTVEQFQATIRQFGGESVSPAYAVLTGGLGSLYASFYPSIQANPNAAKVTAYLEALAAGVEAGSAPFL